MSNTSVEADPSKYPGFLGVGYPEVFTTMPPQPKEKKTGQLPEEKVKEFFDQGFTVVENFFTLGEIESARESFRQLVDEIAQKLYKSGRIKNLYEDYGLENRLIMLEKEWPGAVMLLLKLGKLTPEFRALFQSEKLLNALEQLLGPEIAANPVWNTRPKAPGHKETLNPWHQDSAYFDHDAYKTMIVTSWIALVDATEENGCMQFVKGGHRKGLVGVHTCSDNFYLVLDEEEIINRFGSDPEKDFVTCPVNAGGVIFFNNNTPHRSIPNKSDHIRWAIDFRYQSPHRPWGFYGMKSGVLLRSPDQPDIQPDWELYNSQDRFDICKDYEIKKTGQGQLDEFDTTITGPWMERWKIGQHNKHIDTFLGEKANKQEAQ